VAVNKVWAKLGLTGGTSDDLDGIPSASLTGDDFAIVNYLSSSYNYQYSSSSSSAESSPDVIKPDDAGATGRWLLRRVVGAYGENLLINPKFAVDQERKMGSSITATNYYLDGWFNPSGGPTGSLSSGANNDIILTGTTQIAQIFGKRTYDGSNQISGIVNGDPITISGSVSGTVTVYAGYAAGGSGSALTLSSIGTLTASSPSITYTSIYGATAANQLAIRLSGSGAQIQWIKVEAGSSTTDFQEARFEDELKKCEFFYRKSYPYLTAPGTASSTPGAVTYRNMAGGTATTHAPLPAKVDHMDSVPTVTIYSSNSGTAAQVYDVTTTSDVGSSGPTDTGETGFSTLITSGIASNDIIRFHYVFDARR